MCQNNLVTYLLLKITRKTLTEIVKMYVVATYTINILILSLSQNAS